jgi:hypothetical protein
LNNNDLHEATGSWEREPLNSELRLRSYGFLKIHVVKYRIINKYYCETNATRMGQNGVTIIEL